MTPVELVGWTAGVFGIILYMPQLIKSGKTKKTKDLSLLLCIFIVIDCYIWVVYGILKGDQVITFINLGISFLGITQLTMKLRFG